MSRMRHHLLPVVVLLGAAVVGLEAWWLVREQAELARARVALAQARQERDWLARQAPAPTADNEAQLAADLAAVRQRISILRDALQSLPPDRLVEPVPARSTEAYFQLASLVEAARAQADKMRVTLRPDERFGFATYVHVGPVGELLAPVHRQQQAVHTLLEPLFESRPLALLGIRREAPLAEAAGTGAADFFAIDPHLSLRRPGLIETEPLRLEFTGQTSTLRQFLAGLGALRQPVLVRSVEVEPLLTPVVAARTTAPDAPVPVVRQSLSKFAVTVEFVLLATAPAVPAP